MTYKRIKCDLLVIGAGPAGLSAAITAAERGMKVICADESEGFGGQLRKQIHRFFGFSERYAGMRGYEIAGVLVNKCLRNKVDIWLRSPVLGIYPKNKAVMICREQRQIQIIESKRVVIATGAKERPTYFGGWTLPGVLGAGAAQQLTNIEGVLPGKSVVIIGSGNVGLIVAFQMMQAGADVRAVIESSHSAKGYMVHQKKLRMIGVPIYCSSMPHAALGRDGVEALVFKDAEEKLWSIETDSVLIATGLYPQVEIPVIAGCNLHMSGSGHDPVVETDESGKTSERWILAAGDVCGIDEATIAIEQGHCSGATASFLESMTNEKEWAGIIRDANERVYKIRRYSQWKSNAYENSNEGAVEPIIRRALERLRDPSDKSVVRRYVIIDCSEPIPCDPCAAFCDRKAITKKELCSIPEYNEEKCSGCGICVAICPGMAITMIGLKEDGKYEITIPGEFGGIEEGEMTNLHNAKGEICGIGQVKRVWNARLENALTDIKNTRLITIESSEPSSLHARHCTGFEKGRIDGKAVGRFMEGCSLKPENIEICRCENITYESIIKTIDSGYKDFSTARRKSRAGFGICQGAICSHNLRDILVERSDGEKNCSKDRFYGSARIPVRPVKLGLLADIRHK